MSKPITVIYSWQNFPCEEDDKIPKDCPCVKPFKEGEQMCNVCGYLIDCQF
jgi:hypothetical protein